MTEFELYPGVKITVDDNLFTVEGGFGLQKPVVEIPELRLTLNLIITNILEGTESRFDGALVARSK